MALPTPAPCRGTIPRAALGDGFGFLLFHPFECQSGHNLFSGRIGFRRCLDGQILAVEFDVTDFVAADPIGPPGSHNMMANFVSIDTISACVRDNSLVEFRPVGVAEWRGRSFGITRLTERNHMAPGRILKISNRIVAEWARYLIGVQS